MGLIHLVHGRELSGEPPLSLEQQFQPEGLLSHCYLTLPLTSPGQSECLVLHRMLSFFIPLAYAVFKLHYLAEKYNPLKSGSKLPVNSPSTFLISGVHRNFSKIFLAYFLGANMVACSGKVSRHRPSC